MFSSESTEYGTPDWVFNPVQAALSLNLDVAANHEDHMHMLPRYVTIDGLYSKHFTTASRVDRQDGLTRSWDGERIWCNPPYGTGVKACNNPLKCTRQICATLGYHPEEDIPGISEWVRKGALSVASGACPVAVFLLPARTETDWFQQWVAPYAEVHFLAGRIRFAGTAASAPFPSVLAVYSRSLPRRKQGVMLARATDLRDGAIFLSLAA